MSELHMPPAEPPSPEVAEVLHLLATARTKLQEAQRDEQRANQLAGYAGGTELASMTTRVMQRVRTYATSCWQAEVTNLEHVARSMGLDP